MRSILKNLPDVVPIYPPLGYAEVGEELSIDTRKSQYMKSPGNFATFHCLESYLHGVAGTQGTSKSDIFRLDVKRDIGLVNKSVDGLTDLNVWSQEIGGFLKTKVWSSKTMALGFYWTMRSMIMKILNSDFIHLLFICFWVFFLLKFGMSMIGKNYICISSFKFVYFFLFV